MRGCVCGGWRRVCEGGVWRVEGECEFSTPTESLGTRLSVNENNDTLLYVRMCTCVCVRTCVRACVRVFMCYQFHEEVISKRLLHCILCVYSCCVRRWRRGEESMNA